VALYAIMHNAPSPLVDARPSTQSARVVVEADKLTRRFGAFTAVDGVSFTVTAGEAFGLIGSNGAGKSTLLKMLTTLLPPSGGRASIAGYDTVRQATQVRRHIGYVPQLLSADGALTGWENLLLSARLYDVPTAEVRPRIERALEAMGLAPFAHTLVQGFSGGMIRRLEIAQSMLHRPAVLFMDEPTVGLDPVARHAVLDHIADLRDGFGTTVVVTSHYMEEVELLCDRIAVLSHGRLVALDTPAALKARVGPHATLDDVFAFLAGNGETATTDGYGDVRAARRAAQTHG
jgi:ABC-2 type transport system ATP-binding protein